MRTTLKRGLAGEWVSSDDPLGFPAEAASTMRRYRSAAPTRSKASRAARVVGWVLLSVLVVASGLAGGLFLWFHQSLAAVRAHSPAVKLAERRLDVTVPGHAAVTLLLGDNQRMGLEASAGGRSDTLMLIRTDPKTNTISLLSLPRDLQVPVYCAGSSSPRATTRIDYAFAWCGPAGSLQTVKRLTGLRINYLITVDFHGFKEIVNDLGGVWIDVDRRYYNKNVGSAATDFSNIDLQPGYQLLSGGSALSFVRFRHTDSDFYRQARQQEFLRALKSQLGQHFDPFKLPRVVSAITHNVEVGSCRACLSDTTALRYALFALALPHNHVLQGYLAGTTGVNVGGADELQAPPSAIRQAVEQFTHPAVQLAQNAAAAAAAAPTTPKPTASAPPPGKTTITVLNGNGVAGAAAEATYLLAQRGYETVLPAAGRVPNAPSANYPETEIYFDPARPRARGAASGLGRLLAPAQIRPLSQAETGLRALDPGSLLLVVVGRSFNNALTTPATRLPAAMSPSAEAVSVRTDTSVGHAMLDPLARRAGFPLESPTVIDAASSPDTLYGDAPARLYTIAPGHKAVRLVFHNGNEYWGIEETDWAAAPVLSDRSVTRKLAGRSFQLHYAGAHLHMVVLQTLRGSYWVVNSLLDSLSNKTMLAIAEGLRPLPA